MNDIAKITKGQVKQLRSDARRLETVAKHLRQQAKDITRMAKADSRAEQTKTNFYSKPANVDKKIILTPDVEPVFQEEDEGDDNGN